jgi:PqqD family protein of HPr-rel-A system
VADSTLIWTCYDDGDDWVVYNPVSADVHLMTASAHRLWELIAAGTATVDGLIPALAADLGCAVDDELRRATTEAIAAMDRGGLIRPAIR